MRRSCSLIDTQCFHANDGEEVGEDSITVAAASSSRLSTHSLIPHKETTGVRGLDSLQEQRSSGAGFCIPATAVGQLHS